jgi:hypothetical protein
MQKGTSKVIVDAERNRRTLEKPANRFPWFGGGASSKSTKQVPTTASKVMKKDKKSSLRRGCVLGSFRGAKRKIDSLFSIPVSGPFSHLNRKNTIWKGIEKSM